MRKKTRKYKNYWFEYAVNGLMTVSDVGDKICWSENFETSDLHNKTFININQ